MTFHTAVEAEMRRQDRKGYSPTSDDEAGVDHLLRLAYEYISEGKTVKAGAMIIAARAWVSRNESSNIMQRQIADFMTRCDQEVALYPKLPDEKVVTLRIRLMVEELLGAKNTMDAWEDAYDSNRYTDLLILNKSDELVKSMLDGDIVGIADGIADVLYVVIGTAVAYGINIQDVFNEVHRSNLSKTVWNEDLKRYTIEKDEFGKGIKPPTYSPADLQTVVDMQIVTGQIAELKNTEIPEGLELVVIEVPDNI